MHDACYSHITLGKRTINTNSTRVLFIYMYVHFVLSLLTKCKPCQLRSNLKNWREKRESVQCSNRVCSKLSK